MQRCSARTWCRRAGAARRRLGLVFQEPTVDPFLTVRENLDFAAALAGLDRRQARDAIAVALQRMGLVTFAERRARELSGGWRRLADIARATLHAPSLLILDEPTVGLDPEHRAALWHFLDALRRDQGTAVLFSTHYLAEAEGADAVVLLSGGKVVDRGSPAELMQPFGSSAAGSRGPRRPSAGLGARRAGARGDAGSYAHRLPDRARRPIATRRWSWRDRCRGSPAPSCGSPASRTSTSRAPARAPCAVSPHDRAQRRRRDRAARPAPRRAPAEPAHRRTRAALRLAAAGRERLQRHRESRHRRLVSRVRVSGRDHHGLPLRLRAHGGVDRLRSRVRHAATHARESSRPRGGARRPRGVGDGRGAAAGSCRPRGGTARHDASPFARRCSPRSRSSLASFVSALLGLLVAARLRSVENFAGIINVLLFPMLFISGALYPASGLPPLLRWIARVNPVTHMVELVRSALGQPTDLSPPANLLALGGFAADHLRARLAPLRPRAAIHREAGTVTPLA